MMNNSLHRNPLALDREQHRALKVDRAALADFTPMARLNSYLLNAVEFGDACKEYPIVFVRVGAQPQGGKLEVAPVAVFGLSQGENLFIDSGRWTSDYVPAQLRAYPFAMARLEKDQYVVCIDQDFRGLSKETGMALFDDDGNPSSYLAGMQQYLEKLETELQRTRGMCQRLVELELLQDMKFEATLPDGNKLTVDGFLALNEQKLAALPDATVLELHRNGMLALIHAQQVSMGNMRRLLDRRLKRSANA
jgi:hypothetical protein